MASRPQLRLPLSNIQPRADPPICNIKHDSYNGKLTVPGVCRDTLFTAADLLDEGEIGRGAFGFVNRMTHTPTGVVMAVKRIRSTLNESEQTKTLKDLDVVVKSTNCTHIVRFYGALFQEGDCWICMEMMATSLDKFYKFVYRNLQTRIPETVLGKIATAVISALDYLKTELQVIHRDVKPSNILIDREGRVKLCDFGISGQLVDSIAKSCEAGCKPYMAPERIHPDQTANGYDIRSDVWSFGITMIELATGEFPYPKWDSVFQLLTYVLKNDPPSVPERLPRPTATAEAVVLDDPVLKPGNWEFSSEFRDFVNQCLRRDFHERPKYQALKSHPFFRRALSDPVNVSQYFTAVLSKIPPNSRLEDLVDMNDW